MIEILYYDNEIKKAEIKDIPKIKDKKIWIDATGINKDELEMLKKEFDIHPLTAEDIAFNGTRIKVEEFNNYLFCVFYGLKKTKKFEKVEIDLVLGENFVISNHKKQIDTYSELKKDTEKLKSLFEKGTDFIMHKLLDIEVDNYFPVLEEIDDEIEKIEIEVAKKASPKILSQILGLKRELSGIRKVTYQQRDKASQLVKNNYKFISKKALPYYRDVYDHTIRVHDTLDSYREATANAFDVYMSSISNNMNEVMKTLSIIATIALPLTVVSGIYGTNFDVLPGQHGPYGFWTMILFMILMSTSMIYYFKKKNWF